MTNKVTSSGIKAINKSYQSNIQDNLLLNAPKDDKDLNQFSDAITKFANLKRKRLPLIEVFENLKADVTLGPGAYLDKNVMHDLFQKKYKSRKLEYVKIKLTLIVQ